MLRSKTLFIIGAGASAEINMPTGADLRASIGNLVNIKFHDGFQQSSGDSLITEALRKHVQVAEGKNDINEYLHAGRQIHNALPQAQSIDTFIESHQGNKKIELCGKLAIVRAILDAERMSLLAVDNRSFQPRPNLSRTENTWFTSFLQTLATGRHKGDVDKLFDDVSIISFNYDRSLEQFLFHATQTYFLISPEEAAEVVNRLHIFHPYGRVGHLPWQQRKASIEYGAEPHAQQLLQLSEKIITYGERIRDQESTSEMRQVVAEAETVVFLGFAFHRQNLKLIKPTAPSAINKVLGTAYGLSDNDCDLISSELHDFFGPTRTPQSINLRNNRTCFPLFSEYQRSLSL